MSDLSIIVDGPVGGVVAARMPAASTFAIPPGRRPGVSHRRDDARAVWQ
jgi:hypothetical protein